MADPLDLDAIEKRALLAEIHALRERLAAAERERNDYRTKWAEALGVGNLAIQSVKAHEERLRALERVAAAAKEYRANAKRGHAGACGYWKKEGICSCVVADSGDALDAALKEAGL